MNKQQTIKNSVSFSGIALHTGARASLTIKPAPENTGIIFRRIDLAGAPEVKAIATNVVDVRRETTLASGEGKVYTVEHVMAPLHALNIDNAIIEMDGMEPPISDGSALEYFTAIKKAGITIQGAEARYITPKEPIFFEYNGTKMFCRPNDELRIDCVTDFNSKEFGTQYLDITITPESFEKEVQSARTFVEYKDLGMLLQMGLCQGGSLDNAAIIHNGAIVCKEELRFHNEIVRHKVLDIVGDMYLCGCRVNAHIIAIKPGHPTNVQLAQLILKQHS